MEKELLLGKGIAGEKPRVGIRRKDSDFMEVDPRPRPVAQKMCINTRQSHPHQKIPELALEEQLLMLLPSARKERSFSM